MPNRQTMYHWTTAPDLFVWLVFGDKDGSCWVVMVLILAYTLDLISTRSLAEIMCLSHQTWQDLAFVAVLLSGDCLFLPSLGTRTPGGTQKCIACMLVLHHHFSRMFPQESWSSVHYHIVCQFLYRMQCFPATSIQWPSPSLYGHV